MLKEVEQAELGIQLSSGKTFGGMLFADDFVGVSDSKESLQKLIDVYCYCSKWRLQTNMSKSAVMVFSKDAVNGCCKWGSIALKNEYSLCGDECENVSHVLCGVFRACFMKKLQELLEDDYEDFELLDKVEKLSYVLGSELWESKFDGLLNLVKEYIVDVWEMGKHQLVYDSRPSRVRDHVTVHLGINVSSSAHNCGCVVNGGGCMWQHFEYY